MTNVRVVDREIIEMAPQDFESRLSHVPSIQRDVFALARALRTPLAAVAGLRGGDVTDTGLSINGRTVSWPSTADSTARERTLRAAADSRSDERLFETHKPERRAVFDLTNAWHKARKHHALAARLVAQDSRGPLPRFLGLGAPRCGTTWLYDNLSAHPDIYLPPDKEQEFFGDCRFSLGLNWYRNHFNGYAGEAVIGEMSVGYLSRPDAPAQVARVLDPDVRFIIVLRDPVARAASHYYYRFMGGNAPPSLREALDLRYFRDLLIKEGQYAEHIERWYAVFPIDRFLLLLYEDLRDRPQATIDRVCEFLKVRSVPRGSLTPPVNESRSVRWPRLHHRLCRAAAVGRTLHGRLGIATESILKGLDHRFLLRGAGGAPVIDPETRERLHAAFAPEKRRLARLTGLDLSAWSDAVRS